MNTTAANPTYNYQAPLPKDLFLLRPDVTFLNHGSFGATPRAVFEKYQYWQLELEKQPVEFIGRRLPELLKAGRTALAEYLHTQADNVVYVINATYGVNVVARSLNLKPGDEVVTTNHEYGAMDLTWRFVCQKAGAVYKPQNIPLPVTTAEDFVERFWAGVTPNTKVVFLSHITSPTALIFPVKEICRRARAAGIISVIDGAHGVGQLPLDLEDIGCDFYTSNCHKWLCSPKGSAFLYARPEVQHFVEPLVVSFGYGAQERTASQFVTYQEYIGTRDPAAFLAVPAAIDFFKEHNWDKVRLQCHELARQARERICGHFGTIPISPDSTDWFMQLVTIPLPPCDATKVSNGLWNDYGIVIPFIVWQDKPHVRVSCQAYVTQGDIDRLVEALKKLVK